VLEARELRQPVFVSELKGRSGLKPGTIVCDWCLSRTGAGENAMQRLINRALFGALAAIVICTTTSAIVVAQDTASPGSPASTVPPAAPGATAPASQSSPPNAQTPPEPPAPQKFSAAELDQIIAPVALYPDPLLSQVLRASTYPLEVVEAADWAQQPDNKPLTGNALTEALKSQNWDPSVAALVPFPRVLAMMADRVRWTEQLGNVFLTQQADVMAEVQQFRHEVLVAGKLKPQVTDVTRAAPKRASYYTHRPAYHYAYRYSPYYYSSYYYSPYSHYGPSPHSDGN
jgi:hypothetical protein